MSHQNITFMPFEPKTQLSSKPIELKRRMLDIKIKLKAKHPQYLQPFLQEYPKYNNYKGIQRIRNVMALVTTDEKLTNELEKFAN